MERIGNAERLERARKLADRGKYEEALELIQGLDRTRVKAVTDLSAIADILEANGLIDEAFQIMLRVYQKNRTRRVVYQLTALCIKRKDIEGAERYYEEYVELAPEDSDRYALRFLIDHLKQAAPEVQIASLEALKEYEYMEEWAYELARLYQKSGQVEKCIRECRDIELWFGDGAIVAKAIRLRRSLEEGTTEEERRFFRDEDPEQLTLQFEEELFAEPEPEAEQLTLQFEEDPMTADTQVIDTAAIEEALAEEDPEVEVEFYEMEPEEVPEPEETEESSEPEEIIDEEIEEDDPEIEIDDPLTQFAADLLREDDYILTAEQIGWLGAIAEEIRGQQEDEATWRLQMELRVREIIDRAERRNMIGLLEVAENGTWLESGLLRLEKEDFYG